MHLECSMKEIRHISKRGREMKARKIETHTKTRTKIRKSQVEKLCEKYSCKTVIYKSKYTRCARSVWEYVYIYIADISLCPSSLAIRLFDSPGFSCMRVHVSVNMCV